MKPPPPGRTALYRLYDADDRLLYIGITWKVELRLWQHSNDKTWWHLVAHKTVEWFESRKAALEAEEAATREELPLYSALWDPATGKKLRCRKYDDRAERERFSNALRKDLAAGKYSPGMILDGADLTAEYGIAAMTARGVMYDFAQEELLERRGGGTRFAVPGKKRKPGPAKKVHGYNLADCR